MQTIDWLKYVQLVKCSTNKAESKKVIEHKITFNGWGRRNFDKFHPDFNIIDYDTNFSAN